MSPKTATPQPEPEATVEDRLAAAARLRHPNQIVRVSLPSGHWTMTRHQAAVAGAKVLEGKPARDRWGRWLPHKPHANLGAGTTTITEGDEPANTEE